MCMLPACNMICISSPNDYLNTYTLHHILPGSSMIRDKNDGNGTKFDTEIATCKTILMARQPNCTASEFDARGKWAREERERGEKEEKKR